MSIHLDTILALDSQLCHNITLCMHCMLTQDKNPYVLYGKCPKLVGQYH